MSEVDKLAEIIGRRTQEAKQSQIRFAQCVSVDWENKTMNAKGAGDDTEYLDVILGFGYTDIKPVVGSTCLIGIIDGQEVVTFLIDAEQVELVETKAEKIVFNGGKNGGVVNIPELIKKVNTIEEDINELKEIFTEWAPVLNDGGTALKGLTTTWAGKEITITEQSDIEDINITH